MRGTLEGTAIGRNQLSRLKKVVKQEMPLRLGGGILLMKLDSAKTLEEANRMVLAWRGGQEGGVTPSNGASRRPGRPPRVVASPEEPQPVAAVPRRRGRPARAKAPQELPEPAEAKAAVPVQSEPEVLTAAPVEPPKPDPMDGFINFVDFPPTKSDYYYTLPCYWPDGRGCWYHADTGVWGPYDSENPGPERVDFYKPIFQGPKV